MGYYSNISVELFGDRTQVALLRFLYRNRPNRFSQKQISNSVGIHPSSISRTCSALERFNLVDRFNAGKTILYKIDEESYVVQKILVPLFENERSFFNDLVKNIIQSLNPKLKMVIGKIVLFGSILKGTDTPSSDIDIAIVIKTVKSGNIEKIREHFLNSAVKLKLNLDMHIFVENDSHSYERKGLSLNDVYQNGELIWENVE